MFEMGFECLSWVANILIGFQMFDMGFKYLSWVPSV